jgi:hypothetical protein
VTPLFVLVDERKEDKFLAGLASNLEYVNELL